MSAVQLLYLVEYADFDSQTVIGQGSTLSGSSYRQTTGQSNSDGNATANVDGSYMSYRGIEDFYGNLRTWIDGVNINDRVYWVSNTPSEFADDTSTNYTNIGTGGSDNGYAVKLAQTGDGFIPSDVTGGDSDKGTHDYYYQNTGWRVATFGGEGGDGLLAGAFFLNAGYASSFSYEYVRSVVSR